MKLFTLVFLLFYFNLELFAKNQDITLQLRWKHQFQFAGYYSALYKGFYNDVGLNVKLIEGGPSINPVNEVISKKADFGVSNSSLIIDYLNGKPVVMLGAIFQHSPNVLLTFKEFKSPVDLAKGGYISLMGGDQDIELKAMFLKEGINLSKVQFIQNKNHLQDLVDKKVIAVNAYSSNEPFIMLEKDIDYNIVEPRNYGLDFYGDTLFSSLELYESSPEVVEKFREATIKGWEYALSHQDEIIDLILKKYNTQNKTKEHLKFEANVLKELINPEFVQIGYSNLGRWERIVETYKMFDLVKDNKPLNKFYYNHEQKVDMTWLYIYLSISLVATIIFGSITYYIYRINKKLKKSVFRHKILFQNSASVDIVWKRGYNITDWNTQAEKVFGWSANDVIGKNFFNFLVTKEESKVVENNLEKVLNDYEMHVFINKNITKDGKVIVCEWHNTLLPQIDEHEIEVVSLAIDITERYLKEERLKKQANYDALTLLPNRHYFEELLENSYSLAKESKKAFGVAFIDLDGFKAVNDTYGHKAGDYLLRTLAIRFQDSLREEDTIARLGGDEFALIFNLKNKNSYEVLINRILDDASSSIDYHGIKLNVSASIGVSFYSSENDVDIKELLHQADISMYEAKKLGKNCFVEFQK